MEARILKPFSDGGEVRMGLETPKHLRKVSCMVDAS